MGIIQQLNLTGSVSVYHDYRAGHYSDLSTKGKNGTPTATTLSKGANFDGATSHISIGDIGNIRAIFFSVKPNNLTGSILELINNSSYVTYSAGVLSTTGFTSSTIYVNGVAGTTISSDKSYLVCITDSANIAAATTNLGEANNVFFNGNIGCFLALSVMPTTTQIAQLTAELQNTVWPTAPTTKALPSFSVPRNGLIGEWLLDNVSGVTAPDTSPTAVNGTVNAGCVTENDSLGKSLRFNGAGTGVSFTYLSAVTTAGTYTLSAWFNSKDEGGGSIINISDVSGNRNGITISNNGSSIAAEYWNGAAYTGKTNELKQNVWNHVVFVNSGGTVTGYLNGVVFSNIPAAINALGGAQNSIGYNTNAGAFLGNIKNVHVWNRVLSATEVQSIYNSGRFAIPFKTGFGATQSTADVGGTVGQYIDATPFQCAETVGRWQVATSTINGTLVKTLKNTTAGRAYIDMSKFGNTAEAAYGSWTFWLNKVDAAAFKMNIMNTTSTSDTAGNNGYSLQFSAAEGCQLMKVANGVESQLMAMNAAITAATWTKVKLTRTAAGSWSLYLNDILAIVGIGTNPVTDTTYTTAQYLVFEYFTAANTEIALSDVGGNYALTKGYFA